MVYCFNNLKRINGVRVFTAPSQLVTGCVGLFTLEGIPKDSFIMEYTGEYYNNDCKYIEFVQ